MKKNRIVYFLVATILLLCLTSCMFVKPLEFVRVNSLQIGEKAGSKGIIITTKLSLYNPNNFQLAINNTDIDVFVEGVNLGKLKIPADIVIDKNKEFTGDFYIEISFTKLLLTGNNVISKIKSGKIEMQLKGTIDTHFLWMNKQLKVNYIEKVGLN